MSSKLKQKLSNKRNAPSDASSFESENDKIHSAVVLFGLTLEKCLAKKHEVVDEFGVAMCRRFLKGERLGKVERFYKYTATFSWGAFSENKIKLEKEFFRPLVEAEIVSQIFGTLSKCPDFHFDFHQYKWVKPMMVMG